MMNTRPKYLAFIIDSSTLCGYINDPTGTLFEILRVINTRPSYLAFIISSLKMINTKPVHSVVNTQPVHRDFEDDKYTTELSGVYYRQQYSLWVHKRSDRYTFRNFEDDK